MSEMPSILVVDDESSIRTLAQEILQRKGYTVLTADCADQALARTY
jgi:CheY-like chemotaxis protein